MPDNKDEKEFGEYGSRQSLTPEEMDLEYEKAVCMNPMLSIIQKEYKTMPAENSDEIMTNLIGMFKSMVINLNNHNEILKNIIMDYKNFSNELLSIIYDYGTIMKMFGETFATSKMDIMFSSELFHLIKQTSEAVMEINKKLEAEEQGGGDV